MDIKSLISNLVDTFKKSSKTWVKIVVVIALVGVGVACLLSYLHEHNILLAGGLS